MKKINSSKITILPENLANKIAAGEVVERPASVVKELIENAIDAGAAEISVFIAEGGKKLIQVVDNGRGIAENDVPVAFLRHATSKIRSEKDIEAIATLGFRGEALPSIASVSQVEIKTRTSKSKAGTIYTINGGTPGLVRRTAFNVGTSITIKNLFFNVPARRKFLKSNTAENQQIMIVIKRFMLAYPDIAFEFWVDGKQLYTLKKSSSSGRVKSIFGAEIFNDMLSVDVSLGGATISGFIGKPSVTRRSRSHQHLFLNGRPIQDRSLSYAIVQGYGETVKDGNYPVYCLFLTLDPGLVDVNIHPTKMKVRFSNDRTLYYLFMNMVRQTLNNSGVLADLNMQDEGSAIQKVIIPQESKSKGAPDDVIVKQFKKNSRSMRQAGRSGQQLSLAYFSGGAGRSSVAAVESNNASPDIYAGIRLWQVHKKYIFSEIKSGVVIIDQHLAHARVLYEKTLAILNNTEKVNAQKLLFPQKLTLALDDFLVFKDIREILHKIGFSINIFSGNTIVIDEMPADVKIGRESQILMDIFDFYKNQPQENYNLNEKIAAGYAFKNAIKSGEELNPVQMNNLVDQLFACQNPFYAPDGKPVIISLTLEDILAKFR